MKKLALVLAFIAMANTALGQTITVAWDPAGDAVWTVPEYRIYKNQTSEQWITTALSLAIPVVPGEKGSVSVSSYGWKLNENLDVVWAEGEKSPAVSYEVASLPPPPPPELCAADGTGNIVDEDADTLYDEGCQAPAVSANGTTSPPASRVVDESGRSWFIDSQRRTIRYVNGGPLEWFASGIADVVLRWNDAIYVNNASTADGWYLANGTGWTRVGADPRNATPPPPPPSDATPPVVVSLNPKQSGKSANVSITATATDNVGVASITLLWNGSPFYTCTGTTSCSASVNKVPRGTHTVSAIAKDAAGLEGQKSTTVTVK